MECLRYRSDRHSFSLQVSNYRCKGDPFTRGQTPAPYLRVTGRRADGSSYLRRVRTDEVESITPKQALKLFDKSEPQRRAERKWLVRSHPVLPVVPLSEGLLPKLKGRVLSMTAVPQHVGGVRYWWRCPMCGQRAGVMYFADVPSPLGTLMAVGCRTCLGLTYASQARSKTPTHDLELFESTHTTEKVWTAAAERHFKRHDRRCAGMATMIDHLQKRAENAGERGSCAP